MKRLAHWKSITALALCWFLIQPLSAQSVKTADPPTAQDQADQEQEAGEEHKAAIGDFLRIRRDAKRKPVGMETSVTRYEKLDDDGNRISVDLIGVVHIGEKDYYKKLNEQFKDYDVLLYELVAPEGTRVPRGGNRDEGLNPVAALQKGMQSMLGLEFQLDHIDYHPDNFVHADMTPDEFLKSMEQNDESFLKMAFRAVGQSLAMQQSGGLSDMDLMMAMMSKDRTLRLRRMMAEQMQDLESGMVIFEGKDGSTIIHHRNRKALEVMSNQIGQGKRKLALFYGAGHLPDMEERLINEHGMKRAGKSWLTAWNLSKPKP